MSQPTITWVNAMNLPAVASLEVFRRLAGTDLPDGPTLERATRCRVLRPGEALFTVGDPCPFVFVVNEGLVKMVYETSDGNSWIKGFAEAGVCFASLTALDGEAVGVTSYSAYAEGPCTVERIDYRALQALAARHLPWQRAMSNAFKLYGQRKERREMELLTLSPQERYLNFVRQHPQLAASVRQRDIASYVRITPVALSRIRSRLRSRGLIV